MKTEFAESVVQAADTQPSTLVGELKTPHSFERPRLRAFLVGVPLIVGLSCLSVYADMASRGVQMGVLQLAPPAIFALFVFALLNKGLMKWTKVQWLSSADLLIIYVMGLIAVLVSTRGLMEKLIPPLAYLPYFATKENKYNELLTQHLPGWALPFVPNATTGQAPNVIRNYWEGGSAVPWSAWIGPLATWFGLWCCVALVFLGLATVLRRQWMDNEQLRFPLTALPLAMIRNDSGGGQLGGKTEPFWNNRLMWIGVGLGVFVFGINGLSANIPAWPNIVTSMSLAPYFSERPWNQMDYTAVYISLAAIGFLYFLPTDLLFSLWFFFLLTRVQDLMAVQMGAMPTSIGTHNARIWTGFQAAGAYLILIAAQVRIGWPYFKQVFRTALGNRVLDDSNEMMSYRNALVSIILGFIGIVLWLSLAGMHPLLAALQMGIYIFFIALIMSRAVAEAGILMTETSFLPSHLIGLFVPMPALGAQNLTMLALTNVGFTRDLRGVLLSPFLDSQKMAKELNVRPRSLLFPICLALLVAFVVASAYTLYLNYSKGGLSLYRYANQVSPNAAYGMAAAQINGLETPRDATAWGGLVLGAVATAFMVWARAMWTWFPFNPLGYAIAPTWTMSVFWFPAFAAWVFKGSIMRFGGSEVFRKLSPLMLGLIAGEFGMMVFWTAMNMWRGWSAPIFPNGQ